MGDHLLEMGDRILVMGDHHFVMGDRLVVMGDRLLVLGDRLLVTGDHLLVKRNHLLVMGDRLVVEKRNHKKQKQKTKNKKTIEKPRESFQQFYNITLQNLSGIRDCLFLAHKSWSLSLMDILFTVHFLNGYFSLTLVLPYSALDDIGIISTSLHLLYVMTTFLDEIKLLYCIVFKFHNLVIIRANSYYYSYFSSYFSFALLSFEIVSSINDHFSLLD